MATLVNNHDKHNLVNVGILDAADLVLDGLVLSLSRTGLESERDAVRQARDALFNAKMDLRRAVGL